MLISNLLGDYSVGAKMVSSTSHSIRAILTLGILAAILLAALGAKQSKHTEEELKECKKASRKTLKQILKELGHCNTEWKNKTKTREEHSKKMGCVVRCILDQEKMLDDHGLVTNETLVRAVGDRAQGKFKTIILHLFQQCDQKFGKTLDPNDENCRSYAVFGQCIQDSVADMCHVDIPF